MTIVNNCGGEGGMDTCDEMKRRALYDKRFINDSDDSLSNDDEITNLMMKAKSVSLEFFFYNFALLFHL